jgi:hypothetical protein
MWKERRQESVLKIESLAQLLFPDKIADLAELS